MSAMEEPQSIEGNRVILIVEDDEDDYLLLSELLQEIDSSLALVWKKNGQEAFELFKDALIPDKETGTKTGAFKVDLAILDLKMPIMDGFSFLKKLRILPETRHIPVLVHSNSTLDRDIRKCYEDGGNLFIKKPSGKEQIDNLKAVLESVLSPLVYFPK